jgi:hypothetical protein
MAVFYRGPCARITSRTFEVWHPQHRVFAIRELSYVHVVETPSIRGVPATVGSSTLASMVAVVLSTRWLDVPAPFVALALVVALVVAAGACLRVRSSDHELRAVYRGQMVSLFGSSDAREFGQVRRALVRSMENVTDA